MENRLVLDSQDPSASRPLIRQTKRDEALSRLEKIRAENLAKAELEEREQRFIFLFLRLLKRSFCMSLEEIREKLPDEDLPYVAEMLAKRARPRAMLQRLFTFGVPAFGWVIGHFVYHDKNFWSWIYVRDYAYLRRVKGDDFFPVKLLHVYTKR